MAMAERRAEVVWEGNLTQGKGNITSTGSGAFAAVCRSPGPRGSSARTDGPAPRS